MAAPSSTDQLHFGYFAEIPEYRQVNRELIRKLFSHLPDPFVHVDVATGTGLVPQLLIEEAQARGSEGLIIGVDHDEKGLEIARARTPQSDRVTVEFIRGDARDIQEVVAGRLPVAGADSVSIHDAIHEIDSEHDQRRVYEGMARIAKDGAFLSSNSSFTTVSMSVENSLRGHGEWKLHVVRLTGAKRSRDSGMLVYRSPEDYKCMIQDAGFRIVHDAEKVVQLSREALKAISRYPAGVEGFCRDLVFSREFSLEELSQSLIAALDKLRFDVVPRVWHEVIAERRPR